jgi:hypothetical protein
VYQATTDRADRITDFDVRHVRHRFTTHLVQAGGA